MNKVNLIGNVGNIVFNNEKDESQAVLILSIATNYKYIDKSGQEVTKSQWHKVVIFRKMACIIRKTVKVGDRFFVEGKIEYSEYSDKEGVKRIDTSIHADLIYKIEKL